MTDAAVLSPADRKVSFWNLSIEEVSSNLQTDIQKGLNEDEGKRRLEKFGPNQLPDQKKVSAFKLFLDQFSSDIKAVTTTKKGIAMKGSKFVTKDPICGMTVDEAIALHAERDGKTFYFCGDHCREKFLSTPAGVKAEKKSSGCCG